MTADQRLNILKMDLQRFNAANDDYLRELIKLSEKAIEREGISLKEDDIESDMLVIQYAAYLFRKRAGTDTSMPRYLRWQMNNILMSQKAGGTDDV